MPSLSSASSIVVLIVEIVIALGVVVGAVVVVQGKAVSQSAENWEKLADSLKERAGEMEQTIDKQQVMIRNLEKQVEVLTSTVNSSKQIDALARKIDANHVALIQAIGGQR